MAEPGTLTDLCETLRGLLEIERSLAAITGGVARATPEAQAAVLLVSLSSRHAWRAEQLEARWPAIDPAGKPPPLTPLEVDLPDPQQMLSALSTELLPGLLATYDETLAHLDSQLDGPSVRVFGLARADVGADLERVRSALSAGTGRS